MAALLDVNVLLALFDSDHVNHGRAHEWLDENIADGWASCAITESGFVRIISQPRYPGRVPPATACSLLREACAGERHEFWGCDVSVVDERYVDSSQIHGHRQITDAYLLALAVAHGGRFVTLDQAIPLTAVPDASADQLVVLYGEKA